MNRLKKAALITRLIEKLRNKGSWCGETHIQKAVYLLENLFAVPMDFDFILYKHGPFSFDLRDELTSLRADNLLKLLPQVPPYGPKLAPTKQSEYIENLYTKTLKSYERQIEFVADNFGDKGVAELESLATALYVTKQTSPPHSVAERAQEIVSLKPHVSSDTAYKAVKDIDNMRAKVRSF